MRAIALSVLFLTCGALFAQYRITWMSPPQPLEWLEPQVQAFVGNPLGATRHDYVEVQDPAALETLPADTSALRCSGVRDEDVEKLKRFSKLVALDLSGSPLMGKGLDYMKSMKNLEELLFRGCQSMDAAHLGWIAKLKNLTSLDLLSVQNTGALLPEVFKLKKLERLSLPVSPLSAAFAEISNCKKLAELELVDFSRPAPPSNKKEVVAPGLDGLAALKNLHTFSYYTLAIDPSTHGALLDVLQELKDLEKLNLQLNLLPEKECTFNSLKWLNLKNAPKALWTFKNLEWYVGSAPAEFAPSFGTCEHLKVLCLGKFNVATERVLQHLDEGSLESAILLDLGANPNELLKSLANAPNLRRFATEEVASADLRLIGSSGKLESLYATNVRDSNAFAGPVLNPASKSALRRLLLQGDNVETTKEFFEHIGTLANLEELRLGVSGFTFDTTPLAALKGLRHLELVDYTPYTWNMEKSITTSFVPAAEDWHGFVSALTQLETLRIDLGVTQLRMDVLDSVRSLTQLHDLELHLYGDFGEPQALCLGALGRLTKLHLSFGTGGAEITDTGANALRALPIADLTLRYFDFSTDEAINLIRSLSGVTKLTLAWPENGESTAKLLQAVAEMPALTELRFSHRIPFSGEVDALRESKSLVSVSLSCSEDKGLAEAEKKLNAYFSARIR